MTMSEPRSTAFEDHAREQARAWLRLSHADRLRWLEEAKRFAAKALAAAAKRKKR